MRLHDEANALISNIIYNKKKVHKRYSTRDELKKNYQRLCFRVGCVLNQTILYSVCNLN